VTVALNVVLVVTRVVADVTVALDVVLVAREVADVTVTLDVVLVARGARVVVTVTLDVVLVVGGTCVMVTVTLDIFLVVDHDVSDDLVVVPRPLYHDWLPSVCSSSDADTATESGKGSIVTDVACETPSTRHRFGQ
jgi:sporulation-control protein spo0M